MFITITLHFSFTLHQWNQVHNYKTVILDNPFKVRVSRSLSIQLQLAGSPVCFLNRALSRARPAIFFYFPLLQLSFLSIVWYVLLFASSLLFQQICAENAPRHDILSTEILRCFSLSFIRFNWYFLKYARFSILRTLQIKYITNDKKCSLKIKKN